MDGVFRRALSKSKLDLFNSNKNFEIPYLTFFLGFFKLDAVFFMCPPSTVYTLLRSKISWKNYLIKLTAWKRINKSSETSRANSIILCDFFQVSTPFEGAGFWLVQIRYFFFKNSNFERFEFKKGLKFPLRKKFVIWFFMVFRTFTNNYQNISMF